MLTLTAAAGAQTHDIVFSIKPDAGTRAAVEAVRGHHAPADAPRLRTSGSNGPELMGCIFGSSAGNASGLYRISSTQPTMSLLTDKPQATGGGTAGNGKYFCQWYLNILSMDIWSNMVFDTTTWEWTGGIGQLESQAFDLAYDDATNRIYGCFFDPDENYIGRRLVFGWMDPETYAEDYAMVNPVCDLFECFSGLAFDGAGSLFALTKEGILYQVDKLSGDRVMIGETGLEPQYNSSAAIDPASGLMYYFLCTDAETALYTIDTLTAEATKVYVLPGGEEVQGLAIFNPLAESGAPAQPSVLSTSFDGGNLTGTVNFTIPANTYDGQPGQGSVDYAISYRPYDDAEAPYQLLTQGTSTFGAEVQAPVTLPDNGQYTFGIVLSNAAGAAPMAVTDRYVGYDTPISPYDLTLTAQGNTLTLTWTTASGSLHNGYMDTEGLTFRITRFPDEVVVATAASGNTYSETLQEPEARIRYHYSVETNNHGVYSFPGVSNFVALGHYTAPYVCNFESADEFAEYTVVTKAESPDNYFHWEYHTGMQAAHLGNGRVADDDLLISPAIYLAAGQSYEVKLTMSNNSSTAATFALRAGSAASREAMQENTLIEATEFTCRKPQTTEFAANFTPQSSGSYHFGLHSLTPGSMWDDLYLHSLSVISTTTDSVCELENGAVEVTAAPGGISIKTTGILPADVTAVSGVTVFRGMIAGRAFIPAAKGLYLVKAGSRTYKILVR